EYQNNTPIRILEVGAGTGGSTDEILKQIKPFHAMVAEYAYTDISKAFLLSAEKNFGDWESRINYQVFDVTQTPEGQGIDIGSYDVVIASNVLHATPVLRETLRNIKSLLKKNGILLLIETTTHTLFNHLTFGLLDGWWVFEDETLRISGSPLATVEQWKCILESEGFQTKVPIRNEKDQQHIILAESNGVIRQKESIYEHSKQVKLPQKFKKERTVVGNQSIRTGNQLFDKSIQYLKNLVGDIIHLSPDQIDSGEPLERYGFDSILMTKMTNALR